MKATELSRLIDSSGLSGVTHRVLAQSEPGVHITSHRIPEDFLPLGGSKIGGHPDFPLGWDWPAWKDASLSFLTQINLAELTDFAATRILPSHGLLYFFYSADQQTWGFDPKDRGSWQVLYSAAPLEALCRHPLPPDLEQDSRFRSCTLSFMDGLTLPPRKSLAAENLELDESEEEHYLDLLEAVSDEIGQSPRHQLLGHPDPIQGDMQREAQLVSHGIHCGGSTDYRHPRQSALEADAASWRLLLQLDSDENAGMMWGDSGRLYFWIRDEDLAELRFDQVWMILQCA